MGKDDSSTLMLGAMCWLLGEEKAKKLARSVVKVSKEYKRTLKELEIDITESKNSPDMGRLARSFAIDTEDKSKQDILAEIRAKTMDGRYDTFVDSFEDPGEYVHTSPPSTDEELASEEPSEEPSEEEESIKQVK
jgi:Sec-independent protein translocase protein TatA